MVIRLRIILKRKKKKIEAIALINSGYESFEPEILIPLELAKELKLIPSLPSHSEIKEYILADGRVTRLIRIKNALDVLIKEEDRTLEVKNVNAVISEESKEILISDKLASKLKIVALDFGEGIWCFRDELGKKERKSY